MGVFSAAKLFYLDKQSVENFTIYVKLCPVSCLREDFVRFVQDSESRIEKRRKHSKSYVEDVLIEENTKVA